MQAKMGVAKRKPSNRSSAPPCPGIIDPESFTPARLFAQDSNRSPICDATETKSAAPIIGNMGSVAAIPKTAAAEALPAKAPIDPDHVFFGLIAGASFGPPTTLPTI